MAFPNIFENVTCNNVVNVKDRNVFAGKKTNIATPVPGFSMVKMIFFRQPANNWQPAWKLVS